MVGIAPVIFTQRFSSSLTFSIMFKFGDLGGGGGGGETMTFTLFAFRFAVVALARWTRSTAFLSGF